MEGSGSDPLDTFFNCVSLVNNVQSSFRKISKNFEDWVIGVPKIGYSNISADYTAIDHHIAVNGDVNKKNASFLHGSVSFCANGVEHSKERCDSDKSWKAEGNLKVTAGHLEMAWSVLIGGFFSPIENRKSEIRQKKLMVEGSRGGCLYEYSSSLLFGRVGGVPSSMVLVPSGNGKKDEGINSAVDQNDSGAGSTQKLYQELLGVPLSTKDVYRSTISTISLKELSILLPPIWRSLKEDHPDKKKLSIVEAFFTYTEGAGKKLFQELDTDNDGQVLFQRREVAIKKRELPKEHSREFMYRSRSYLMPSNQLQKDSR